MAVLHHAHAGAAEIEELRLSAFESRKRQCRRARVEIQCSSHGGTNFYRRGSMPSSEDSGLSENVRDTL